MAGATGGDGASGTRRAVGADGAAAGPTAKANSRGQILAHALELFSRHGYDGVGIAQIVAASGVTKPTLYYFFHSKEGLLDAIIEEYYAPFNDGLREACRYEPCPQYYERDVHPVLVRVCEYLYDSARGNRDFFVLRVSLESAPPVAHATVAALPRTREQLDIVGAMFEAMSAVHGGMRGRERLLAAHFIACVNADIASWLRDESALDHGTALATVRQFMHGIFS